MLRQQGTVKNSQITSQCLRTETQGKFLTQRGEYTELYCTFKDNCMLMRQFDQKCSMLYSCGFSLSCSIVDVCFLPFRDGSGGVVVAVNDDQNENYFLAYYSIKMGRVVRKIKIRKKITKIVTVLDATKRKEIDCLHGNLNNSPHLLAVGTHGGHCYLVHFGIDSPSLVDMELRTPSFSSNICIPYIDDGRFRFRTKSGATVSRDTEEVYVTAISYLERCKTIVVGFSCGVFITVNLLTGTDASYYYSSSPVFGFACQEPMDDPRPVLYLWIAFSSGGHRSPHVSLCVVNFPNDEGLPANQWSLSELLVMNYLTWSPENCVKWLSFRTVIVPISAEHLTRTSISEGSSSSEETIPRTNGTDTSRVLMTWITADDTVEGALFDLNAYYYKRLPRQVTFDDDSLLKQNAFLALFTLPASSDRQNYLDCLINYQGIIQYRSPHSETNEVFMFAPSHSLEIITFNGNRELTIAIPSMQKVVLKWLDENFEDAMESELACAYLNAVGLAKTSADTSEQATPASLENASVVVSSLLFSDRGLETLKRHIVICPNYDTIHKLAMLIWKEVVNAKQKFDERSEPWFDRIPQALSVANMCWLRSTSAVFSRAAELFAEISKRVPSGNIAEATTVNYNMMAAKNLVYYTNTVFLFHRIGLLPCKNYIALHARMKAKLDERKKRLPVGAKLYIVSLLEEIRNACPDETFWCGLKANDWYPPNSIWALFSAILAMKITDTSKDRLIGYFLLDYDDVVGKEPKAFDRFKWRFPYNDRVLCSQIRSNWEKDCGLQVETVKMQQITAVSATEEPASEVDRLMKRLLLNNSEILIIKEGLLKRPGGVRRWNQFCLGRKMFSRLLPPERPKDGILTDRVDRWTASILKDLPSVAPGAFPRTVLPAVQRSAGGGKVMRETPSRQRMAAHPYLSPILRTPVKPGKSFDILLRTCGVPKSRSAEGAAKAPSQLRSPVYDGRILNYESILPKEDVENVQRVLQTPTPRRRCAPGISAVDPYASPTEQHVPVPIPTSILKTNKGRQEENMSVDVGEPQSKNLRFDIPNSSTSELESTATNIDSVEEQVGEGTEMDYFDASDSLDSEAAKNTQGNGEVVVERHFEEQEEEPEDSLGMGEMSNQPTYALPRESPHKISFEEQSESDFAEEEGGPVLEAHESAVERHFEQQEEEENNLLDTDKISADEKGHPLIPEVRVTKVISYEEQEEAGMPSSELARVRSDDKRRKMQSVQDISEQIGATTTTQSMPSDLVSTREVILKQRPPKKRSNEKIAVVLKDPLLPDAEEPAKEVSFEEQDESDPTSAELEVVQRIRSETELAEENEKMEVKKTPLPEPETRKSPRRRHASGSTEVKKAPSTEPETRKSPRLRYASDSTEVKKASSPEPEPRKSPRRRNTSSTRSRQTTPKRKTLATLTSEGATGDGQAVRLPSESPRSSSPGSEVSASSHRMLTRSAAKAAKLASLSPESERTPRKRLHSEISSTYSHETTPKRSTRIHSATESRKKTRLRTVSEQAEHGQTTPKASPGRRTRAASEDIQAAKKKPKSPGRSPRKSKKQISQKNKEADDEVAVEKTPHVRSSDSFRSSSPDSEMSTASHSMVLRSASKARSESGSPSKQHASSRFEPALEKIDEVPARRIGLRAGRKTVAQVLEERQKKKK